MCRGGSVELRQFPSAAQRRREEKSGSLKDISQIGNAQRHRGILLNEQNGHVVGGELPDA
jgi:hypothetical protein